jgi:signal transduction histidine kinase/ActR/RegA family two-component response regulator
MGELKILDRFRTDRYSIGVRLGAMLGILVLLMAALISLGLIGMKRIQSRMDDVAVTTNAMVWNAHTVRDSLYHLENTILNIILSEDTVTRTIIRVRLISTRALLARSLEEAQARATDPEMVRVMDSIRKAVTDLHRTLEGMLEGMGDNGPSKTIARYNREVKADFRELYGLTDLLVTLVGNYRDRHYEKASALYTLTSRIFLGLSAFIVLLSVWMGAVITRSITQPLRKGVSIANSLAEGDFSIRIDVRERGEPGQLLTAMQNMFEKLKHVKELEQQLIQSQKLETVGKLAGGVAHDFNNLLTAIMGHCELGLLEVKKGQPIEKELKGIMDGAERAGRLTRQLLAFSRRQVLQPGAVNLNALIRNLNQMMARLIGENIELIFHLQDGLKQVRVDPNQIEQVIMNLVVNARDAMPDGGGLIIETRMVELDRYYAQTHMGVTPGRYVMLAVSDTGSGMAPDVKDKIFEPFFTTKEIGRGSGLGLSTVYGIIKQSGGSIWVYSEPGKGATFKIYLPETDRETREKIPPADTRDTPTGSERILVVEDDEKVRRVVVRILQEHGYAYLEAADGAEAIALLENGAPPVDLVITDLVMPGMSGIELAERIAQHWPGSGILFMSGYTDRAAADHGFLKKGCTYLQKPFTADILARKVRDVLDRSGPSKIHAPGQPGNTTA